MENPLLAGQLFQNQNFPSYVSAAGSKSKDKGEIQNVASFIGFAPVDDPKFVMLVSLQEPESSPWGAETAAPLWFNIAQRLAYYWDL